MNPEYKFKEMLPWYKNFKGSIRKDPNSDGSNYIVKGKWR